jgi:mono/diheme cytochrome c family protein
MPEVNPSGIGCDVRANLGLVCNTNILLDSFGLARDNEATPIRLFFAIFEVFMLRAGLPRLVCILMFAGGCLGASAQSKHPGAPGAPNSPATAPVSKEQRRVGENVFMQNCSFCHLPRAEGNPKSGQGKSIGPPLKGLMQGSKPVPEAVVRAFILNGSADKMPGFKYSLEPKEIDALIAYLKTF